MYEPTSAKRVDSGACDYECDNQADYRVEVNHTATFLTCNDCSKTNRIWVEENELVES